MKADNINPISNKEKEVFDSSPVEKEDLLDHWKWIVRSVLYAESSLYDRLRPLIKDGSFTYDQYVETIAKEILSKTFKEYES